MAQTVYSVNSVGYVNLVIAPNFSIIANPLDAGGTNNTVANLFAGVSLPNNFKVYKFINGGYSISTFKTTTGLWSDSTLSLAPGEAAFVNNPSASPITNTFVGTVMQGSLTASIPRFNVSVS